MTTPSAPTPSPKHFPVSWEELHRDSKALAWRLAKLGPWKGIIAITRGGMVPATVVAWELNVRVIETISIVGYEDDDREQVAREARIVKYPANVGNGEGWLIIDDLVDTGRTAEVLRRLLPKAHIAAIYAKPLGCPLIDTFVIEVSQDTWISFAWETFDKQNDNALR